MKNLSDVEVYEKLNFLGVPEKKQDRLLALFQNWPRIKYANPADARNQAVVLATEMFVKTGIENNITKAFELYQKNFSETDFPLRVTKESNYNIFPDSIRPVCPECGKALVLDRLNTNRRNQVGTNEVGIAYATCWVCADEDCGYIGDWSTMDVNQWRILLMKEGA